MLQWSSVGFSADTLRRWGYRLATWRDGSSSEPDAARDYAEEALTVRLPEALTARLTEALTARLNEALNARLTEALNAKTD